MSGIHTPQGSNLGLLSTSNSDFVHLRHIIYSIKGVILVTKSHEQTKNLCLNIKKSIERERERMVV